MATIALSPQQTAPQPAAASASAPWYIWLAVLSVTSAMVGGHWDISWHRSIGRDTFWTPAHIAIYLCGVLSGISCGYLILSTTFGKSPLRAASVNIWGFRGPLGAFIAAWGGFAMLASAPFDDWWHNAYGLDVKILSPPHVVLSLGIVTVAIGALILILAQMNRAGTASDQAARQTLERLFLYTAGMIVVAVMLVSLEYQGRVGQHSATLYRVMCMLIPMVIAMASRATGNRWAATYATGVYSILVLGFLWILPLFPATPKLGPVYNQVTHFVPTGFPILIVIPAMVLDWMWSRTSEWGAWKQSLVSGAVFLAVLVAVQWPFATFLMSPGARNWFFGSAYFDYLTPPTSYQRRNLFFKFEPTAMAFWNQMALAFFCAVITTRLGVATGNWMRKVRR